MISIKRNHFIFVSSIMILYIICFSIINIVQAKKQYSIDAHNKLVLQSELNKLKQKNENLEKRIFNKEVDFLSESKDKLHTKLCEIFTNSLHKDLIKLVSIYQIDTMNYILVVSITNNGLTTINAIHSEFFRIGKIKQSIKDKNIFYIEYKLEKRK